MGSCTARGRLRPSLRPSPRPRLTPTSYTDVVSDTDTVDTDLDTLDTVESDTMAVDSDTTAMAMDSDSTARGLLMLSPRLRLILTTLVDTDTPDISDTEDSDMPDSEGGYGGKQESQSWVAEKISSCLPSLSKKQRIIGFMSSLIFGTICFGLAVSFLPMLVINPRKFSLLFSLGSLFTISSFSFLWGPYNHLTHLFSKERLPFTMVYFTTLIGTLYFAMGLQSAILTPIAAILQVIALVWFVVSYIPGGQTGLKFFTKLCSGFCRSSVNKNLPV